MADVVRAVCVELLRTGPSHNQLLSPLTRYMTVCGDAPAGEVSAPYEHAQLIRRLDDLRYHASSLESASAEMNRRFAVSELGREMARFLAQIPGLRSRLAPRGCQSDVVHLEIVANAAELSVLQFEPAGCLESQGQEVGDYLLLGPRPRVTLTRRLRNVSDGCPCWPTQPKILFVASNPTAYVPFQQHLESLLRALGRWLPPLTGPSSSPELVERYAQAWKLQITILEHATIGQIARACAENDFTHVHVLAHGAIDPNSPGRQYGIALHSADDRDKPHVVSGAQFATAIRRDGGGGPSIVTPAACDSGNVNDFLYTGASFAHEVHRAGIPFVLASQLPLTMDASVDVCEQLYTGLLLGEDPRKLLHDLRLRLHSLYASATHDWASLVAYAAFPSDLEAHLVELRWSQV